jgi:hypothetical protein
VTDPFTGVFGGDRGSDKDAAGPEDPRTLLERLDALTAAVKERVEAMPELRDEPEVLQTIVSTLAERQSFRVLYAHRLDKGWLFCLALPSLLEVGALCVREPEVLAYVARWLVMRTEPS